MKCLSITLLFLACSAPAAAADTAVPYPEGYRDWRHLRSMVIEVGHPLFVFDLLEAQRADNAVTEGARKVAGVMHKDARKFASTGGRGFEGFAGDSKTERHDFVFSRLRD